MPSEHREGMLRHILFFTSKKPLPPSSTLCSSCTQGCVTLPYVCCFLYTECDPAVILGPQSGCYAASQVWVLFQVCALTEDKTSIQCGQRRVSIVSNGFQGTFLSPAQMRVRSVTRYEVGRQQFSSLIGMVKTPLRTRFYGPLLINLVER